MKLVFVILIFLADFAVADFFQVGPDPAMQEHSNIKLPDFRHIAAKLTPSVVNITTEGESDKSAPEESSGSGFIVSEDGYIMTNHHVVKQADKIVVRFVDDKRNYEAEVIGADIRTDLALLKIDYPGKLKPLYVGDSNALEVGEWVLAIGNQFQLGQTVTAGIVSAKARKINVTQGYDSFIQTDASINPGSSGGPLINTKGEVVGINTAIISPGRNSRGQGFNVGVGFAFPINYARKIISELRERGNVSRGMLGVIIQAVDEDLAAALNLSKIEGALVSEVMPGTPAALASIKVKDVVISYDGVVVKDYSDLPLLVGETSIGQKVMLEVIRDGKTLELFPVITELAQSRDEEDLPEIEQEDDQPDKLGLIVQNLDPYIIRKLKLKFDEGVYLESIVPNSLAVKTGLRRGDILLEINGQKIASKADYRRATDSLPYDKAVLIMVYKKNGIRFTTVKLDEVLNEKN